MNILITGGSGLVGRRLTNLLKDRGHTPGWLSRSKQPDLSWPSFRWDVQEGYLDPEALHWADAVVHLAGAGVADQRWTAQRKKVILESRTRTTELLLRTLQESGASIQRMVSASAIGYYGFTTSEHILTESDPAGNDFLAQVTVAWEKEVQAFAAHGISTAMLRIGIVLAREGGAVREMTKPPVLAPLGSGKQWMPWIHVDDLCALFLHALESPDLSGPVNAVAPHPESNADFTKQLAKHAGKVYLPIPVPAFVLRLALGEMAQMLVNGTRISPSKAQEHGFQFRYEHLEQALTDLYQ